ncbi:hypothetical protein [Streptomyces xanthophaeus]|uniref:hypothetical protein n=1 Tax=Streptomyces xanthophaeus TaxID=67385 RepID=UPI0004CCCACC|nr:hypothetical protein [Streptomyces xanthophaeus]
MIQGFRPQRWLACAVLAAAALTPAVSAAASVSATSAFPAARPAARSVPAWPAAHEQEDEGGDEGDGYPDLAGSAAGAGRDRPGRPVAAAANPEALAASRRPQRPRPRTEPVTPPRFPGHTPPPAASGAPTPAPTGTGTGRTADPDPDASTGTDTGTGTGTGTGTSTPHTVNALGTRPNERAADLAAHILPLGTGFALMGVGLGYLGMRLRKGI